MEGKNPFPYSKIPIHKRTKNAKSTKSLFSKYYSTTLFMHDRSSPSPQGKNFDTGTPCLVFNFKTVIKKKKTCNRTVTKLTLIREGNWPPLNNLSLEYQKRKKIHLHI